MTEKTPKTPRSDQTNGPSKDQADVSGVTKPDSATNAPKATPADKASASSSSPAASPAPSNAAQTQKPSEIKSAVVATEPPVKADTVKSAPATEAGAKGPTKSKSASKTTAATARPEDTRADSTLKTSGSGGGSNGTTPPPASSEPSPKKSSSLPLVVISIAVVLLAGGLWYHHATSQDYIERLESQARSSADQARQAEQKAQQALDSLSEQRRMLASLRSELQVSQAELQGLGTAFQTITDRGSDLVLLNDIDHLVMIAQQQLQLNGNVANAIISLETAQAQLARANRPALASLQQTINGDLDRLRAATTVDIALLSSRLDELAGLIPQAPLLVPDDTVSKLERTDNASAAATKSSPSTRSTEGEWWEKALARSQEWTADTFASLRHELGQFVSVRRVDDAAALLISPDQASRFRDSLRQRIMTAQLALMMDQSLIWETETDALLKAVQSRFDPQSGVTRQAIRVAREVADTAIDTPLPDVNNTIKALEAMNEQMGRGSLPPQSTTDAPAPTNEAPAHDAAEPSGDETASDNTASSDAAQVDEDDASSADTGFAEAAGSVAEPDQDNEADSPVQADNNQSDVNNGVSPAEEESGTGDSEQTTNGESDANDSEESEAEVTDDTTSGGDGAAVQGSDNTGLKL